MELWPFLIVALIAVVSAVMMLLSNNAVHSALFLILVMVCIAFLFLLLNAPFLAMVQITVYAGAIMVLFLFVIMLLGAEKLGQSEAQFRWFAPIALFLSVAFLLTAGLAIVQGKIDLSPKPSGQPQLRVVNIAPYAGPLDIYANNELLVGGVDFRDTTDFISLPAGEYTISVNLTGSPAAVMAQPLTLENGDVQTVIAYGTDPFPVMTFVGDDLSSPAARYGRLVFFNGDTSVPSVQVVNIQDNLQIDRDAQTGEITDPIIISNLEAGVPTSPRDYEETQVDWAFVDTSDPDNVLFRLHDYDIPRDESQLIILTRERMFDGSLRPLVVPVVTATVSSFGGPEAIGIPLFTSYLLPFEMVSVLLLVAMIGAIILTHREIAPARERQRGRRKVSRPLTSVIAAQTGHDVTESSLLDAADIHPTGQPEAGD